MKTWFAGFCFFNLSCAIFQFLIVNFSCSFFSSCNLFFGSWQHKTFLDTNMFPLPIKTIWFLGKIKTFANNGENCGMLKVFLFFALRHGTRWSNSSAIGEFRWNKLKNKKEKYSVCLKISFFSLGFQKTTIWKLLDFIFLETVRSFWRIGPG